MKEIRAICRPNRLHALRQALRGIPGCPGVTVLQAKGFSAPALIYNRTLEEDLTDFTEKVMVCIVVTDNMVDTIVDVIMRECRTGRIGDGIVWLVPVEGAFRIQDSSPL
ncbi:MAG: P-II family nitrogen regulator [Nitrosospira sp.]|nr:P-II family nitrogen regulator [Nitrosospira sp.]